MRYVTKKAGSKVIEIYDEMGVEVAGAFRSSISGKWTLWTLPPRLQESLMLNGPSLAGLLIDAGFEGVVDFE